MTDDIRELVERLNKALLAKYTYRGPLEMEPEVFDEYVEEAINTIEQLAAEIVRLREENEWQPIETCPPNVEVMAVRKDGSIWWCEKTQIDGTCELWAKFGQGRKVFIDFTHWQPRPKSPTEKS